MADKQLQLDTLIDGDSDEVIGWWSEGHHCPLRFAQKVSAELKRPIGPGSIVHSYWRWTGDNDSHVFFEEVTPKQRNAFKVTFYRLS